MDFNAAAIATSQNLQTAAISVDTSAWVLKRDDEKRFIRPVAITPRTASRTRNPFYAAKGNAALRSVVVDFL